MARAGALGCAHRPRACGHCTSVTVLDPGSKLAATVAHSRAATAGPPMQPAACPGPGVSSGHPCKVGGIGPGLPRGFRCEWTVSKGWRPEAPTHRLLSRRADPGRRGGGPPARCPLRQRWGDDERGWTRASEGGCVGGSARTTVWGGGGGGGGGRQRVVPLAEEGEQRAPPHDTMVWGPSSAKYLHNSRPLNLCAPKRCTRACIWCFPVICRAGECVRGRPQLGGDRGGTSARPPAARF